MTETKIGCVQHDCEKCKALEAQVNTCGSGAGCLHKDARIDALTAERDAAAGASPQPDKPLVSIELPQGDTRTVKVFWTEFLGDVLNVCIRVSDSEAQPTQPTRDLIEECRSALAEELSAWDIDPPLHHVQQAHDKCIAWLLIASRMIYCAACEQHVSGPCNSRECSTPEDLAQPVPPSQAGELFRAGCKECDRQKQANADNKEWQEGVKRGNEIVSAMAHAAINAKGAV